MSSTNQSIIRHMEGTVTTSERGQVLPLALLVLAAGMLIATPFLGHASSTMIGSRTYAEVMIGQYSCEAGIEWALWRLKKNPVLTTNPNYSSAPLLPLPNEINGSSFPDTQIRYVKGQGPSMVTITPPWQDGQGWHDYPVGEVVPGTITVVIGNITSSRNIQIRLKDRPNPAQQFTGDGPYIANFEINYTGSCTVQVRLPATRYYRPMGPGPITITITYPTSGGGAGTTETIIPIWLNGPDWVYYPFRPTDKGMAQVIIECDAQIIRVKLENSSYPMGTYTAPGGTYTVPVEAVSPGQADLRIMVQTCDLDNKGREIPYTGPGTITITYPIASYDIKAEQDERSITVRATASYLATRVLSWQIK